jgi:hypothetical protein
LLGAVLSIIIAQTLTCNFFNIKLSFKKLEIRRLKALSILFISMLFFLVNITLNYIFGNNNILVLVFSISIVLMLYLKYILGSLRFILNQYYLIDTYE